MNHPIRIHFSYKTSSFSGGGANNFLRALQQYMLATGDFVFTDRLEEPADILFMNELNQGFEGPQERLRLNHIKNIRRADVKKNQRRLIIVRAVNLRQHSYPPGFREFWAEKSADKEVLGLLSLADFVIFQSRYQQSFFSDYGFRNPCFRIIHNGASEEFAKIVPQTLKKGETLTLVSATASPRPTKRHDIISKISEVPGVEILHFGLWPEEIPLNNVKLMGEAKHGDMIKVYGKAHAFLHPAVKDPCPNAIIEALSSGLPVLFNSDTGSSNELVGDCGLAIDTINLALTISALRENHANLLESVHKRRFHYSIKRAATEYIALFKNLLGEQTIGQNIFLPREMSA